MTEKSLKTKVSKGTRREALEGLRDNLAIRLSDCSNRDAAPIAARLREVMEDLEALGGTAELTPEQQEQNEMQQARERRAERKGTA